MKNPNEREEILHLEDLYCLRQDQITAVTIDLQLWHYHIYRVFLRITEGHYSSLEEINDAIGHSYARTTPKNPAKHFAIICIPRDFLCLAEDLIEVCELKKETERIYLEDRYGINHSIRTPVNAFIKHNTDYVSLLFIEGNLTSPKQVTEYIHWYEEHYSHKPAYFEIACRPEDLIHLAKALTRVCEGKQ
jgi:hypothetical protein